MEMPTRRRRKEGGEWKVKRRDRREGGTDNCNNWRDGCLNWEVELKRDKKAIRLMDRRIEATQGRADKRSEEDAAGGRSKGKGRRPL